MKLLVIGHARHGKDTVCELLAERGFTFLSSSLYLTDRVIMPVLAEKYGYATAEGCYADRGNHREEWLQLIRQFNGEDPARLAKEIFAQADIYCGLRHREEFTEVRKLVDHIIWVDATARRPTESPKSMHLNPRDATYFLDNNGPEEELAGEVDHMIKVLGLFADGRARVYHADESVLS